MITLYEGLTVIHLLITVVLAYKLGKVTTDVDTLYEGVALTMKAQGLDTEED